MIEKIAEFAINQTKSLYKFKLMLNFVECIGAKCKTSLKLYFVVILNIIVHDILYLAKLLIF